ncbi:hypothetical protein A4A49_28244 [Nicotiana attenuata]|uniref:Uncharacterized protein n=1 Tax=Nicotiana attenuata TaxID=49451 RepID=A0A1J6K0S0_NICAT|nr:hypothetical protein A4A49_28244 [Nicotiana attenuata]
MHSPLSSFKLWERRLKTSIQHQHMQRYHEHAVGEKYSGDLRLFLKEKRALKEGDGWVREHINPIAVTQASKSHQGDHEYAENPFKTSHVAAVTSTAIVPVETAFARFSQDVAIAWQSNSCPVAMDNVVLMRNNQKKSEAV